MVHALDSRLEGAPSVRDLIDSECDAFTLQHQLVLELTQVKPPFGAFLSECYPGLRVLHGRLARSEIEDLYSQAYRERSAA
jgi:hypothetical protein